MEALTMKQVFLFISLLAMSGVGRAGEVVGVSGKIDFTQEQKQKAVQKYGFFGVSPEAIAQQKKVLNQYFVANKKMRMFVRTAALVSLAAAGVGLYYYFIKSHQPAAALPGDVKKLQDSMDALTTKVNASLADQEKLKLLAASNIDIIKEKAEKQLYYYKR